MKIEGKRVLVTGASSGIGLALSEVLAEKRAVLVLASRRLDRLKEATDKIGSAFLHIPTPLAMPCDVSNRESVHQLVQSCMGYFGGIDILINNAGICVYGDTERTPLEDFHSIMDVNFFGALHGMLEVLPTMKQAGKGLIVNIASVAALHGIPYLGAYGASKAALVSLSQSLRAELSKSGISVLVVYPGYTQTDIFKNEKRVGGAHRPPGPYAPASRVAKTIVRAIEGGKWDLVLSPKGKTLAFIQGVLPRSVNRAMERIASELRD